MKRKFIYALIALILLSLTLRLYFSFSTPNFSSDDSYYVIRQVENIMETGQPIIHDDLSFSGRNYPINSFYYYLLSFFGLFMPLYYVFKIIPNIFATLLIPVVYLIAYELTKDEKSSLFTAFICAFIPIYFSETVNSISNLSLVVPLCFFAIFAFMGIQQKMYLYLFIVSLLILTFTSALSLILILSFIIYLIITKIEDFSNDESQNEIIIFSLIFCAWINFLLYRGFFEEKGLLNLFSFIPTEIWLGSFSNLSILSIIYKIGLIPLTYGVYAIYMHVFYKKDKMNYLLISFVFACGILLWLKFTAINNSLTLLGVGMSVLFATFYKQAEQYLQKTKFDRYKSFSYIFLSFIFITTSVIPSITYAQSSISSAPNQEKIDMFVWLEENTYDNDIILSSIYDGHLISGLSNRKNVHDSNFLLAEDLQKRTNDINEIYTFFYQTRALKLLSEYDIDYIILTPQVKEIYGVDSLAYVSDKRCFRLVYAQNDNLVYEVRCKL